MTYSKLVPSKADPRTLVMRMAVVRAETANDVNRSVEVVVATENPVERWDERRNTTIREVLLMRGLSFRTSRKQLPIVDSHDRSTVRNILGSVRNLRVEGDSLVGDATFASDPESQMAYQKVKEGHITDFSVTATPNEVQFIERGQRCQCGAGEIEGPADIVTRWQPTDASLVATGADPRSTVRDSLMRSYFDIPKNSKEVKRMSPETIKMLVAQGMPSDLEDPEQMILWLVGKSSANVAEEAGELEAPPATPEPMMAAADVPAVVPMTEEEEKPEEEEEMKPEDEKKMADEILKADATRRKEIVACCQQAKIERGFADKLCDDLVPLDKAKEAILNELIRQKSDMQQTPLGTSTLTWDSGTRMEVTRSADDKFQEAARDGLITRAMSGTGCKRPAFDAGTKPAQGYEDFATMDLMRLAEQCCLRANIDIRRMQRRDIALIAMGHERTINRLHIQRDAAYHTTGSFSNLMLDAANKTLRAGYEEALFTWNIWARQGASAQDMKALNRIMLSEMPNMEMVPENHEYPEAAMSDARESYKVSKFGSSFSVTWETIVNDDMDALSRIPAAQGVAARRTQNQQVYGILTANANMSDGKALFATDHASGSNLETSGGAPTVARLNTGFTAMALQKGVNTTVALNITPRYLIVPRALEATALEIVGSTTPPTVGGSAVGTSGYTNLYGPGGPRQLQVVADAVLDANSAAIWYLAASPSEIDTVELTFLGGEESPVLENEWDMKRDTWYYKIRQTFGVKAIDWRGLYENDGA